MGLILWGGDLLTLESSAVKAGKILEEDCKIFFWRQRKNTQKKRENSGKKESEKDGLK